MATFGGSSWSFFSLYLSERESEFHRSFSVVIRNDLCMNLFKAFLTTSQLYWHLSFQVIAKLSAINWTIVAEVDLGMFSMFGRIGAPTKGQLFFIFLQHSNKPEIFK